MCIVRKMRSDPIQQHTDAGSMKSIHQGHKRLRIPEAGSGRKITGALISPAAIEGEFHYGHEFYMSETHFFHIRYKAVADLVVGIISFFIVFVRTHPTREMHF